MAVMMMIDFLTTDWADVTDSLRFLYGYDDTRNQLKSVESLESVVSLRGYDFYEIILPSDKKIVLLRLKNEL